MKDVYLKKKYTFFSGLRQTIDDLICSYQLQECKICIVTNKV